MGNEGKSQSVLGACGWSTSGRLVTGNGRNLGTELQANPTGTVVKLQADFEDYPGEYTIAFGIDTLGSNSVFMAEALISWLVEGNEVRRRVSVANGTTISGCGQAVSVTIWDTTPTTAAAGYTTGPYTANLPYTVSAQLTRGVRSTKNNQPILIPPLFQNVGALATVGTPVQFSPGVVKMHASDQVFFPIPSDAGVTAVMVVTEDPALQGGAGNTSLNITATLENSGGGFATTQWTPVQYPNVWVPLSAGANAVGVVDSATAVGVNSIVGVYYAIDG